MKILQYFFFRQIARFGGRAVWNFGLVFLERAGLYWKAHISKTVACIEKVNITKNDKLDFSYKKAPIKFFYQINRFASTAVWKLWYVFQENGCRYLTVDISKTVTDIEKFNIIKIVQQEFSNNKAPIKFFTKPTVSAPQPLTKQCYVFLEHTPRYFRAHISKTVTDIKKTHTTEITAQEISHKKTSHELSSTPTRFEDITKSIQSPS